MIYGSAYAGARGVSAGLQAGFWAWLGFVVTSNSASVLFEKRPVGLYLINTGYYLVSLPAMGALLALWQ